MDQPAIAATPNAINAFILTNSGNLQRNSIPTALSRISRNPQQIMPAANPRRYAPQSILECIAIKATVMPTLIAKNSHPISDLSTAHKYTKAPKTADSAPAEPIRRYVLGDVNLLTTAPAARPLTYTKAKYSAPRRFSRWPPQRISRNMLAAR